MKFVQCSVSLLLLFTLSINSVEIRLMLLLIQRFSSNTVVHQSALKMNSDSTDFSKLDFDISMVEFFGDLQGNTNNVTEIENQTLQNYFSSECGSFPDLEKVGVSYFYEFRILSNNSGFQFSSTCNLQLTLFATATAQK